MRIRTKFQYFSAAVVFTAVTMVAAVAFFIEKGLIVSHLEEVRTVQSAGFAAVCRQAITTENELFMINFAKLLVESPGVTYAYYVDADGRIRVHTDKAYFYKTIVDWNKGRPSGVVDALHPVRVGDLPAGSAVIGFSENYVKTVLEQALARTLTRMSWAVGAVILLVLPAAILFAILLTGPIRALERGSEAIGHGDFSARVEVKSRDELGDLAMRFNEMAQQLAILDEMKDEFISSVSHDLRSPMSAVKMYTQYMLFEDPDRDKILPQHRTFLLTIMESATRLGVFVTNMLDAAKIKAGRAEYHVQPMDAAASVRNVHGLFGILADKKGVSLREEIAPDLPKAMGDAERMDHVVANLVSNSLKFTPAGGTITVGAKTENGRIVLWVGDTGKGISQENLGKLFRRFGQVDVADQRAKRVTGTGLGLYIVKQTVEGMGGKIEVTSELGKGTCFTVTLAAAPPDATVLPPGLHG